MPLLRRPCLLLVLAISACTTAADPPGPDASIAQAEADVAMPDAAATSDAPEDADPCWRRVVVTCGDTLTELCVPEHGCAFYTCDGMSYGYCGPQS